MAIDFSLRNLVSQALTLTAIRYILCIKKIFPCLPYPNRNKIIVLQISRQRRRRKCTIGSRFWRTPTLGSVLFCNFSCGLSLGASGLRLLLKQGITTEIID